MSSLPWKMPPMAKIYEALSAVADDRVVIVGPTSAQVTSSSKDKTYDVEWSTDMSAVTSNDNASYWQGYIGYPIVAVLLKLGRLEYDPHMASYLAGVHWKQINDKFKRDYDKAVEYVLQQVEVAGENRDNIIRQVELINDQLATLGLRHLQQQKVKAPPRGK